MPSKLVIAGGIHGNELTGIYLVRKFQALPDLLNQYTTLEIITLLANPRAIAANRRYIDRDLNRSFAADDLANPAMTTYESLRAKEIAHLFPQNSSIIDSTVVIDTHSSTSAMGLTILPASQHPFNLRLCAYLTTLDPAVRVVFGGSSDNSKLRSLTPLGCTIEVGPLSHGTLSANLFQQTEMLVHAILNYIDSSNQGNPLPIPDHFTAYQTLGSIDYPRNSADELQAMLHPQVLDYQPLHSGDPLFITFTGEIIFYEGKTPIYPIFVNEAAYLNSIALTLTEKQRVVSL